jgi:hypothetical protein
LTQRIEQIIQGQPNVSLAPSPEVERKAQNIAASLLSKYARSDLVANPEQAAAGTQERAGPSAQDRQDQGVGRDLHTATLRNSACYAPWAWAGCQDKWRRPSSIHKQS